MAKKVNIFGYKDEFKSVTDAIIFLLKENKSTKEIIKKIPSCTNQQIYLAKKKMNKI